MLSVEERSVLAGWARRRKTSQALALRARIVLCSADGGTIGEVAAAVGVSRNMVSKWRARFLVDRLDGLSDEPRPGRQEKTAQCITRLLNPGAWNGLWLAHFFS
ncbi:helix-turn-helix domain-containing protein [Kribbella sp. NPDC050281]|uniref:helix-turn-helix domain-containing protein n=1 Tax=Kribbella sp. NPDC050281 TaxID=3155515 RepID=UPI0033ECABCD